MLVVNGTDVVNWNVSIRVQGHPDSCTILTFRTPNFQLPIIILAIVISSQSFNKFYTLWRFLINCVPLLQFEILVCDCQVLAP